MRMLIKNNIPLIQKLNFYSKKSPFFLYLYLHLFSFISLLMLTIICVSEIISSSSSLFLILICLYNSAISPLSVSAAIITSFLVTEFDFSSFSVGV